MLRFRQISRSSSYGNQFNLLTRARSTTTTTTGIEKLALSHLTDSFRRWGHLEASLDPLNLNQRSPCLKLKESQFEPLLASNQTFNTTGIVSMDKEEANSQEIYDHLKKTYCGKIGAEFEHLIQLDEREWFSTKMETLGSKMVVSKSDQRNACTLMMKAFAFENFMGKKYSSYKRYSGEGAETMLLAIDAILATASGSNINDVVIGMPHRGRLALLVSLLGYPPHKLFHKVQGKSEFPKEFYGVDDVTSHIATSIDKSYGNQKIHVSLVHNPSHLEIVNTVVNGKVKGKQDDGSNAMSLLLHGDAAFSGQGCVTEGFSLSQLPDFKTNGTIHIIVNNQVGFTTTYPDGRSSLYCSDAAKIADVPILHVNGESVDDVIRVARLATEYRNTFHKDVVIDLVTYRRYGHNEVDEPSFTQPKMYKTIRALQPFPQNYANTLEQNGILTKEKNEKLVKQLEQHLENEHKLAQNYVPTTIEAFQGKWKGFNQPTKDDLFQTIDTGLNKDRLLEIGHASIEVPKEVKVHERLQRTHILARQKMLSSPKEGKIMVDWATAEAMAFGSLLQDGYNVRLSGQDCRRGTFSQRHAILVDQNSENGYCPLANMKGTNNGRFTVVNSNLSELAVMAYEFGYSWESPKFLSLWEAQFGDFCNGSQIVIDQFLAASESKWMRQSGIVLLLPHGYDGAGPEHSSGKLERFLQLCDSPAHEESPEYNMIVANPTTPANYFHLLRRQMVRNFRRPLIIMSPKTLLRSPSATSSLEDMDQGSSFRPVIQDDLAIQTPQQIQKVLFCSGKIYYDLVNERVKANNVNTAIIRIEELAPFPSTEVAKSVEAFSAAKEFIWVQEEPSNQGAWSFVQGHLEKCLHDKTLQYIGRAALPAAAVGVYESHSSQVQEIFKKAFP